MRDAPNENLEIELSMWEQTQQLIPATARPAAPGNGTIAQPLYAPGWLLGIAGGLGAFLGWLLVAYLLPANLFFYNPFKLALGPGIFAAAIPGAMIGLLVISVMEGYQYHWLKMLKMGLVSLGFGLVGGAVGGLLVEILFELCQFSLLTDLLILTLLRAIGWGASGLILGLAVAVVTGSGAKMVADMWGGFLGGLIGGALYGNLDVIGLTSDQSYALTVIFLGSGVGLATGLAREKPYTPQIRKRRF